MKKIVSLKTETWKRDSHGLFDYESKDTLKHKLESCGSSFIIRQGDNIVLDHSEAHNTSGLAQILFEGHSIKVQSLAEPLWRVIRNLKEPLDSKGHILKQGDTIKFGRVKYYLKELRASPLEDNLYENIVEVDQGGSSCKICLSEIVEEDNPLISPCKCDGTMKYIHVQCLKLCVKSQMVVKSNEKCMTYTWKSVNCTLCGQPFPNSVCAQNKTYNILLVEKPETPYFIIESLTQHGNNRGMHIVSMKNSESVVLGRGHDTDIRISDISVSRVHAKVKFMQGAFVLEDFNSKFGTLVQVESTEVTADQLLVLQSGRSLLQFKIKNK